jgi:hypothetical protein
MKEPLNKREIEVYNALATTPKFLGLPTKVAVFAQLRLSMRSHNHALNRLYQRGLVQATVSFGKCDLFFENPKYDAVYKNLQKKKGVLIKNKYPTGTALCEALGYTTEELYPVLDELREIGKLETDFDVLPL